MSNSNLAVLANKLALSVGMQDGSDVVETLKATAFKGQVSDAQMTALLIVAQNYRLNPWTKEIYAFPDKNNGIVPVVGIDGWSRIINEHPQFDGIDFQFDDEGCTCIIYRKDRTHPVKITEYMAECKRATGPWQSHPRRMLRHKAMIQCARVAFGFGGIFDQDEAERIVENKHTDPLPLVERVDTLKPWPDDLFAERLPEWRKAIAAGKATADAIVAKAKTKHPLTAEQEAAIRAPEKLAKTSVEDVVIAYAVVADEITKAIDSESLANAGNMIGAVADPAQRSELAALYNKREAELMAAQESQT